jgi:putative membrane protein
MLKKKLLKGVLGVSAVAALFAVLAVQAQSPGTSTGETRSTSGGQSTTTGTPPATSQGASGQGTTASGSGTTAPAATAELSKADQKIVLNMAQANMAEIEAAKLAQSKSQNEQIKNFAQQMIDDHTKALGDVQQLAQTKGVTLPSELDKTNKAKADKLAAMSGDAFDRAYMAQAGVADHKKVHGMLRQAQSRAKDPDVKALAARILPTVDQHLNSAQQLQGTSKGTAKGARTPAATPAPGEKTSSQ